MPEPIIPEEEVEVEEERAQEVQQTRTPPQNTEVSEENLALSTALQEDIQGEKAEKLLEPMELEETEAIPRRRGKARIDSATQSFKEVHIDPKEGAVEGAEKAKAILEHAGAAALHHVPGLGLLASGVSKRKVLSDIKKAAQQFEIINQTRMKLLSQQPRAALELSRNTGPISFWEKAKKFGVNLLLANTLEYAAVQLQKRFKKLQRSSTATDIQAIGAGISTTIIGAPIGAGIAGVGSAIKGVQTLKSAANFVRKLYKGTLGVERNQHASLLYGLALEYLQLKHQVPPRRDLDAVNKSLTLISTLGKSQEREQARAQAFDILKKLGVAPDPEDQSQVDRFNQSGFAQIRALLQG